MGQYFTNQKLKSNIKKINCVIRGKRFEFYTDNGVFSKDGLDFGSRLLLDFIPLEEVGGKVLDLGCGYGIIGIIINKITGTSVHMVDVNLRALHLCNMNIELNKCNDIYAYESDCYSNIDTKFNSIITNPPIRAGKKIVYEMVMGAKDYLEEAGHLFLVIRKQQGAKSLIRDLEEIYDVSVLIKKSGYYVLKCCIKKNSGVKN